MGKYFVCEDYRMVHVGQRVSVVADGSDEHRLRLPSGVLPRFFKRELFFLYSFLLASVLSLFCFILLNLRSVQCAVADDDDDDDDDDEVLECHFGGFWSHKFPSPWLVVTSVGTAYDFLHLQVCISGTQETYLVRAVANCPEICLQGICYRSLISTNAMDSIRINWCHFHFVVLSECKILNTCLFSNMHEYSFLHCLSDKCILK